MTKGRLFIYIYLVVLNFAKILKSNVGQMCFNDTNYVMIDGEDAKEACKYTLELAINNTKKNGVTECISSCRTRFNGNKELGINLGSYGCRQFLNSLEVDTNVYLLPCDDRIEIYKYIYEFLIHVSRWHKAQRVVDTEGNRRGSVDGGEIGVEFDDVEKYIVQKFDAVNGEEFGGNSDTDEPHMIELSNSIGQGVFWNRVIETGTSSDTGASMETDPGTATRIVFDPEASSAIGSHIYRAIADATWGRRTDHCYDQSGFKYLMCLIVRFLSYICFSLWGMILSIYEYLLPVHSPPRNPVTTDSHVDVNDTGVLRLYTQDRRFTVSLSDDVLPDTHMDIYTINDEILRNDDMIKGEEYDFRDILRAYRVGIHDEYLGVQYGQVASYDGDADIWVGTVHPMMGGDTAPVNWGHTDESASTIVAGTNDTVSTIVAGTDETVWTIVAGTNDTVSTIVAGTNDTVSSIVAGTNDTVSTIVAGTDESAIKREGLVEGTSIHWGDSANNIGEAAPDNENTKLNSNIRRLQTINSPFGSMGGSPFSRGRDSLGIAGMGDGFSKPMGGNDAWTRYEAKKVDLEKAKDELLERMANYEGGASERTPSRSVLSRLIRPENVIDTINENVDKLKPTNARTPLIDVIQEKITGSVRPTECSVDTEGSEECQPVEFFPFAYNSATYDQWSYDFARDVDSQTVQFRLGNDLAFGGGGIGLVDDQVDVQLGIGNSLVSASNIGATKTTGVSVMKGQYGVSVLKSITGRSQTVHVKNGEVESSTYVNMTDNEFGQKIKVRNITVAVDHDFDERIFGGDRDDAATLIHIGTANTKVTTISNMRGKTYGVAVSYGKGTGHALADRENRIYDMSIITPTGYSAYANVDLPNDQNNNLYGRLEFGKLGVAYIGAGIGLSNNNTPTFSVSAMSPKVALSMDFIQDEDDPDRILAAKSLYIGKFSYTWESQINEDRLNFLDRS